MVYSRGEVIITPKSIYWIDTPVSFNENDRIELLKRDVLLINYDGDIKEIAKLKEKDNKYSGYFFNLDGILSKNHIKGDTLYGFVEKLAQYIGSYINKRSLVYTTILDKKLVEIFKKHQVHFFEKNLNDKKIAISTIIKLIYPFFSENNKLERAFVRLNLLPMKYSLIITNLKQSHVTINGTLKDLSLNGMGIIISEKNKIEKIKLKDVVEVKLSLKTSIIKISKAIVARVDQNKFEAGLIYNITDSTMIREDYASILTGIIYNWIKEIIKEHGEIKAN